MAKTLEDLDKKTNSKVLAKAKANALSMLADMSLAEMRKARGIKQADMAHGLKIAQPNISQLENRQDLLLSTLDNYVRTLGGKLEIHAIFPDGQNVTIAYPLVDS
ncbi:MAG: XRE family transcriptional regulator [Proteobacteria bacterium]|nr:XRE family transcriptional regulator [Pseudomonadota bacterium]